MMALLTYLMTSSAECIMAKLPPLSANGVDLASTVANIVGSGLAGALYAIGKEAPMAHWQPGTEQTSKMASTISGDFVAVWTSFPFVAVHFAEVGFVNGLPVGILYVLLSIVSAALAFEVCRQATENLLGGKQPMWARSISDRQGRFRLTVSLGVFILTMVLANSVYLQSTLFANIPEGPAVDQGLHLSLRMAFAVGGGIFATYVGGPPSRTNTVSCLLVGCAYAAARFYDFDPSTGSARMRMIFDIFVGTFCGRLSSFPEIFSYSSSLWSGLSKGKQREREVVELTTNIFVALLFGGVYYAAARRGDRKSVV